MFYKISCFYKNLKNDIMKSKSVKERDTKTKEEENKLWQN